MASLVPLFNPGNMDTDYRDSIIRATAERAYSLGVNRTTTARSLRDAGLRFGDALFRSIFNDVEGFRDKFSYPTSLPPNQLPDLRRVASSKFEINREFGYVGQVRYSDPKTGFTKSFTARYDTDELLSKDEAQGALFLFMNDQSIPPGAIVSEVDYIGMVRNKI